jgi:beta-phosphoglucomutase-like phosphatase (HAD superfamily)
VIGFEDSESGITSIKAAGIGTAAAVPFAESSNHNLSYADFILHGGIPEAILQHNLFMKR